MKKRIYLSGLALLIAAAFTSCVPYAGSVIEQKEEARVESVVINTRVRTTGQYPEEIIVTLPEGVNAEDLSLTGADFHMSGNAGMWGSKDTRPFACDFERAEAKDNSITLIPKDFPEKFFYVTDFKVDCEKNEALSFTEADVSRITTQVADDFQTFTKEEGAPFTYHLFTPESKETLINSVSLSGDAHKCAEEGTSSRALGAGKRLNQRFPKEPMPVVVVFHGFGDTSNLLTYRTAVEWAEPENQAARPCYVIAPVIDDATYYTDRQAVFLPLKEFLDEMIKKGEADPERIYVMGNSFGGMSSIEFAEQYPDFTAGILALCPALTYSPGAVAELEKMKDIPIWLAHAEHDNTIPVTASREAVDKLKELGAKEVHFTEYTDEEMEAAGGDNAPDATYSFHHVELAVMEDDAYMEWLFSVRKER